MITGIEQMASAVSVGFFLLIRGKILHALGKNI